MLCNTCSHCAVCIHRASIQLPSCLSNVSFDCSFYSGNDAAPIQTNKKRSREEIQEELLASRPTADDNEDSQFISIEQEYECESCHKDVPAEETEEREGKIYCQECL